MFSAPKTATKRIFFITDEDNPHPGAASSRLITSARTTLIVSGCNRSSRLTASEDESDG